MVPFEINCEIAQKTVSLTVEQLDRLANENGLMRYDVRTGLRHAVITVNIEADPGHPDFSFEAVQAIDEDFSGDELLAIIRAIRQHQIELRSPQNLSLFTKTEAS
jgi:5,10-methylenetetrahydrofolate reductase